MFGLVPTRNRGVAIPTSRMADDFKMLQDYFFNSWPMLFEPIADRKQFWQVDLKETDKEMVVRAEIPGFEPADLDVELWNNLLVIKADTKHEVTGKDKGFEFEERHYERAITLPNEVDPAKIEATYRNGVLAVHLPKAESAKGHRVPVK